VELMGKEKGYNLSHVGGENGFGKSKENFLNDFRKGF
jgi:hypothetical protein